MITSRILLVLTLVTLTPGAPAQAPRESLQTLTAQLQRTPNDGALREQIIKLAQTLKPAPAIPEEAREPFVMGATVLKKASGPADAGKAVDLFTKAIQIAPWFADAYYNRAIARETAGQYEPAMEDLRLYLLFKLPDQERREVQDKIYALKADAQLVAAKQTEEQQAAKMRAASDTPQAREAALLKKAEGAMFVVGGGGPGGIRWDNLYEIKNGELHYTIRLFSLGSQKSFYGHSQPGDYLVDRMPFRGGAFTFTEPYVRSVTIFKLGPDAMTLLVDHGTGAPASYPRK